MERSLSRAVIIKTKSLPIRRNHVSNSVVFVHRARWEKASAQSNALREQICRSLLSASADGLADGSGERRTSPVNGIELKIAQSCRKVVPKSPLPRFQQRFYIAQGRLRKNIRYPSCAQR